MGYLEGTKVKYKYSLYIVKQLDNAVCPSVRQPINQPNNEITKN